ncbi:MAG: hypothetical protein Q7R96_00545 [Nanoarchaeota archaeon]|nr:hypothetical protein [Nanoarchaeota archaeon]
MNPIKKYLIQRKIKRLEAYEKKLQEVYNKQINKPLPINQDLKDLRHGIQGDFIQKDTSMSSIILVAVCIMIIVGLTIFYQAKFKGLNDTFQQKLNELNSAYETLTKKEGELKEKEASLTITQAGKDDLEDQYTDIKRALTDKEADIERLQQDIITLHEQLDAKQASIDKLQKENNRLKEKIEDLENQ